jgi:MFS family permease
MLRALRHRNYRLFFFGQGVSLIGTWMQTLALPWLVYLITGRPLDLGIVAFSGQILTFVMAPVAGVLADRWNRRRLVIIAQVLATLHAAALAALTMTGVIEVWHIIALALFGGFIRGFEIPTRQSFVVQMVEDRADLPNAIALNSFLVNGARLVGPALAGGIIAVLQASGSGFFGVGVCFLLNAISFLAVIVALVAMKVTPPPVTRTPRHPLTELKEGLRYAAGSPPIRTMLLLLCVISLMGAPYATLMPIFARDILEGNAGTLGLLMAATGVGAVLGALFLASRRSVVGLGRIVAIASAVFGTGLVAFSLSRDFALSAVLLAWAGSGMMVEMAGTNTFLQTIVDEHMRGRVMSFYTMAFMGMGPFGALLAGSMADWIGAPRTVLLGGDICIVAALIFALNLKYLRPHVQPIYIRLGILPRPACPAGRPTAPDSLASVPPPGDGEV